MSDSKDSTVNEPPLSSPFADIVPDPVLTEESMDHLLCPGPLPAAASPTTDSPEYVPESDPEEEPEEDDEDPEEDLADYPTDRDDDDDEEEEEPSGDDADDEDEDKDEDEEEEEPPSFGRLCPTSSPPASLIRPLGYRAAMIRLRAETPSTSHPLPLPTSSPPLQLLSSDHRANRPEITLPPQKSLGIDLGPRYEIGESSAAGAARPIRGRKADYGIRDVWVDPREAVEEVAPMTLEGVNTKVTELAAVQEQDTQDIYAYHYETARLLDQEALVSREAWGRSMEVSYMAHSEIMTLRSIVMSQQAVISQLQAADSRSQTLTLKMLQADHRRQTEIAALHIADRTR
ncbi:hypothetical protein Tco_1302475 [Tanacetum coccineum]